MTGGDAIQQFPQPLQSNLQQMIKKYPEISSTINDLISYFQPPKVACTDPGAKLYTLPELSFLGPSRKKLKLSIHAEFVSLSSKAVEFVLPIEEIVKILIVPTPKKTKAHWTIVIVPKDGDSIIFGFDDKINGFKIDQYQSKAGVKEQIVHVLQSTGIDVCESDASVFTGSKGQYLDCYQKTKDGYVHTKYLGQTIHTFIRIF